MRTLVALATVALGAAATAQQILVVDPLGGGQFVTVLAALAAAQPGDTVLMRGGVYPGHHVVAAPLQLVGDPAFARPTLAQLTIMPGVGGGVSVVRCHATSVAIHGDAALDDVTGLACTVNAGSVVLTGCAFQPDCRVLGGDVVFNRCALTGAAAFFIQSMASCLSFPARPGLDALGGTVAIANSTLVGGGGGFQCGGTLGAPSPALRITGADVRTTRSVFTAGTGVSGAAVPVAMSLGTFAHDASTTFTGSGPLPGAQVLLPATDGTSALAGGTITVELQTQPGLAALVAASLGRRSPTPLPFGAVWFDPAAHVVLSLGATDTAGRLPATIPVPPGVPRGLAVTLQGGALAAGTGAIVVATPVVLHVR